MDPSRLAEALGRGIAAFAGASGGLFRQPEATEGQPGEDQLEVLFVQATKNRNEISQGMPVDQGHALTLMAEGIEIVAQDSSEADPFWAEQRTKMGILESHSNALFLVATLLHVDLPNANDDIVTRAEAEAALPTLICQPMDMAETMNMHQRQRLYAWENGIRGFIYAARMVEDRVEVGVIIWARDFPDIAQKIADFRDSLGASFDLVANNADYINVPHTIEGTEQKQQRILKGITFLGGSLLAKARAADHTTSIGDVRYQGKSIQQIEEEQRMAEKAKEQAAAQAKPEETPVTAETPVTPAKVETPVTPEVLAAPAKSAVEVALAQAQGELTSLRSQNEQASLKVQAAELKLAEVEKERDEIKVRAEAAEGKLAEIEAAKTKAERITARMELLTAMAAENKKVLVEGDEATQALAAEVADLSEDEFTTFKLKKELELLKSGKPVTAGKEQEVQASANTPAQPGVFSALNGNGAEPGSGKPSDLGRRIAEQMRSR